MSTDFRPTGSKAYPYEMMDFGLGQGEWTVVRADGGTVEISARRGSVHVLLEFDAACARLVAAELIAAADVADAAKEEAA